MVEDISESVPRPGKRDASFYLVFFFFAGPIWSVVPVSWAFVAYSAAYWRILSYSSRGLFFFALALSEVR